MRFPPEPSTGAAAELWEPHPLSGSGTIYSFSVVHQPPAGYEEQAPYILALVRLAEGPLITTQLTDCDPQDVTIDMPVEMVTPVVSISALVGFIGLAVPNFLLALVILYLGFILFNAHIGGLFSPEFQDAPWSLARAWDLAKHLPIPALILGLAGTAQQVRIMRANLLDELRKPYVVTARSKGLSELKVILKYPVRLALNPFASTIGYTLPYIVSGSIIVSLVLGLPTVGPLLLKALIAQDMFLAGTIVLLLGVMTVIGTLVSDILLVWIDPRIRLEET